MQCRVSAAARVQDKTLVIFIRAKFVPLGSNPDADVALEDVGQWWFGGGLTGLRGLFQP